MDSRTCSILLNLNLSTNSSLVEGNYTSSKDGIEEASKDKTKIYRNLKSTIKESYLTGSLKYGNNFLL